MEPFSELWFNKFIDGVIISLIVFLILRLLFIVARGRKNGTKSTTDRST